MRHILILSTAVLLTGCGATMSSRYEPPVVDMVGVDQQKWAKDQSECVQAKIDHGFIGDGYMVSKCMEQRGYKILAWKG
jgi:hypothetical protein